MQETVETESLKLQEDFIVEFIKCCLTSEKIMEICCLHMKYQYLNTTAQKRVVKYIVDFYNLNKKLPSIGLIGQAFPEDRNVLQLLLRIKECKVEEIKDDIVTGFEKFIKESRFVLLYDKMAELYNTGKKEEAVQYALSETSEIHEFSLKQGYFPTVFEDFDQRTVSRLEAQHNEETSTVRKDRLVWGIKEIDKSTGGARRKTLGAFMARSGGGKSTVMRWVGLSNARLGYKVVHFSAEGSEDEVMDAYDAAWTSLKLEDISYGDIPTEKSERIKNVRRAVLENGGEIYVYAVDSFDGLTLLDCNRILENLTSTVGPIDMIIWDYLELFSKTPNQTVSSEGMERKRREDVANTMVNLCVRYNAFGLTATQANDIPFEKWNNPDWCMKRNEISEFKGMVKPLAYFFTVNATVDEREDNVARIYYDKLRHSKGEGTVIGICQSLDNGRFYDSQATSVKFPVPLT